MKVPSYLARFLFAPFVLLFGVWMPLVAQVSCGVNGISDDCNEVTRDTFLATVAEWDARSSMRDCNGDNRGTIIDIMCLLESVSGLNPPVFDALNTAPSLSVGETLTFQVAVSDSDGDPISLTTRNLPSGATFKNEQFSWTPQAEQVGFFAFAIVADDGIFKSILEFSIQVTDENAGLPGLSLSPADGTLDVAITRETIVRFDEALAVMPSTNDIYATFAGERLVVRRQFSSDGKTYTLFYSNQLPSSARIFVHVNGDNLVTTNGMLIDADGDGEQGGIATFSFDTLSLAPVSDTSVCGRVFASELAQNRGGGWSNVPLSGVKISVDGASDSLFTFTDKNGNFRLEPTPSGRFFVHIDGRTVAGMANGAYYPSVGKTWTATAGRENSVGDIFLPLIVPNTLVETSATESTEIGFNEAILNDRPEWRDVSITVPADSLYADDGSRGGQVGIAPVDPSRLPGALPPGLDLPLVITVQTDGATNFDVPAPVCFPNLPSPVTGQPLPANSKSALWSFNHDSGKWEVSGSMTVSADGQLVCSDPGVGIRAPGWHGTAPGAPGSAPPPGAATKGNNPPGANNKPNNPTEPISLFAGEFYYEYEDIEIEGRGFNFMWVRKYRSKAERLSPMGFNWDHTYNIYLERMGRLIMINDPLTGDMSRQDWYRPRPDGTWAVREFFRELRLEADQTYHLVFPDQFRWIFNPLDGQPHAGKIAEMRDANGNSMHFQYDDQGRLSTVTDTLDRAIHLAYNDEGLIAQVEDFTGRQLTYSYYDAIGDDGSPGDLRTATLPAVTGTLTNNDFPNGKTTTYTYTSRFFEDALNHNMTSVIDAKGQTFLTTQYSATTNPGEFMFDRAISQTWGEDDDWIHLSFNPIGEGADQQVRTIINDRVGNISEYFFDGDNRLRRVLRYTGRADADSVTTPSENRPSNRLRSDDPEFFEVSYTYNDDALITGMTFPNGNQKRYTYMGDLDPTLGPRSRENMLSMEYLPGPDLAGQTEQASILYQWTYDVQVGCPSCDFNRVRTHTDGRGLVHEISYDDRGNMIQSVAPDALSVVDIEYNTFGQVSAYVWPANEDGYRRRDEKFYVAEGPSRGYPSHTIEDVNGFALRTDFVYDELGRLTEVTDRRGNVTSYTFNSMDQQIRETSRAPIADGIRYQRFFYYDGNDNLTRIEEDNIDENGEVGTPETYSRSWTYGILNEPLTASWQVSASDFVEQAFTYDANRNRIETLFGEGVVGNQPNNRVQYLYDERDLVFRTIAGPGEANQVVLQYDYDTNGNAKRKTLAPDSGSPQQWQWVYDGYDRPVREIDPMGNDRVFNYDANHNQVGEAHFGELEDQPGDANQVRLFERTMVYDDLDRLIRRDTAHFDYVDGNIEDGFATDLWAYSPADQILVETDDLNRQTQYDYDTFGRQVRVIDPVGNTVETEYDANDNVIRKTQIDVQNDGPAEERYTTTYAYDGMDRLIAITDAVGNSKRFRYDSRSNPIVEIDTLGNQSIYQYDGLHRMLQVDQLLTDDGTGSGNELGHIRTQFAWDQSSRLRSRTDDLGQTTAYIYDSMDRMIAKRFADQTQHQVTFDAYGNVVARTDANGSSVAYTYDQLNRLTDKQITPGQGVFAGTTSEQYTYDGLSRMVRGVDDDSTVAFRYDSLSYLIEETQGIYQVQSEFDAVGNRRTLTYPGGRTLQMTFSDHDHVTQIQDGADTLLQQSYIGERLLQRTLGNQTSTLFQYNGQDGSNPVNDFGTGLIANIEHFRTQDQSVFTARQYQYDPKYRKTLADDLVVGVQRSLTYDSVARLTQEVRSQQGQADTTLGFSFDGAQNRLEVTRNGVPETYVRSGDGAAVHQYSQTPFDVRTHDENGNFASRDAGGALESFTYDYQNRLVTYTNATAQTTVTNRYDVLGRRFAKEIDIAGQSSQVSFVYEGRRVIETRDAADQLMHSFVVGEYLDDLIAMDVASDRYFYHLDDQYSVASLTDSNSNLVERYDYDAYGSVHLFDSADQPINTSAVGNPYFFQGRWLDEEYDLYCWRSRFYDAEVGRFISRDQIGIWGDASSYGNGYAFLGNDPYNFLDPEGEDRKCRKKRQSKSKNKKRQKNSKRAPKSTQPKEHTSNKRPSTKDKHTKPRAGRPGTKNRKKPGWRFKFPKPPKGPGGWLPPVFIPRPLWDRTHPQHPQYMPEPQQAKRGGGGSPQPTGISNTQTFPGTMAAGLPTSLSAKAGAMSETLTFGDAWSSTVLTGSMLPSGLMEASKAGLNGHNGNGFNPGVIFRSGGRYGVGLGETVMGGVFGSGFSQGRHDSKNWIADPQEPEYFWYIFGAPLPK